MDQPKKIYLAQGTLKVKARGYWYTSGGEKGPFGFYPHLKDREHYPVFPDTQLRGDLRMAVKWLTEMDSRFNKEMIVEVFGGEPTGKTRQVPSRVYLTDLTLTRDSKDKWVSQRFEVKPRIAIDDKTRTVEEHMLLNMEVSYLDGLDLEANIYLGYFESKEKLNKAKDLIEFSLPLLSGFGQSRSRGYGRGEVTLKWDKEEEYAYTGDAQEEIPSSLNYVLKNLVNLRNKPVHPGSTQFIESVRIIPGEKLRGWFVKVYNALFGTWPEDEQIASIEFPDLYPAIVGVDGEILRGITPPMTTLKNELGQIGDILSKTPLLENEDFENFFRTKTKPLPDDYFVTTTDPPIAFTVSTERRIRNQIGDRFVTAETAGLFVQELIHAGTCFAGTILFRDIKQKDFLQRALFILKNVKPIIGGSVFDILSFEGRNESRNGNGDYFLVTRPLPFCRGYLDYTSEKYVVQGDRVTLQANIIAVDTLRSYNTTLNRPKRPKICVKPGSVLLNRPKGVDERSITSWIGFGRSIEEYKPAIEVTPTSAVKEEKKKPELPTFVNDLKRSVTRAQLGFLKEFLNRSRDINDIRKVAEERSKKYREKDKREWESFYNHILNLINGDSSGNDLREFIGAFLEEVFEYKWEERFCKKRG